MLLLNNIAKANETAPPPAELSVVVRFKRSEQSHISSSSTSSTHGDSERRNLVLLGGNASDRDGIRERLLVFGPQLSC